MLPIYIATMVAGGVLVAVSVFLGGGDSDFDKDLDLDVDADIDIDVSSGLDGALGLAPGASVFNDGAGDSSLGVDDTSLDFDAGGAADDLLAGFDLDEIDAMNLAEIFPGTAE